MKYRKTLILIGTLFCSLVTWAQKDVSTTNTKAIQVYYEAIRSSNEGSYDIAIEKFKDAISRDKLFVEAYWGLADVYNHQKKDNMRIATLRNCSYSNFPKNDQTLYRLGTAYFESGLYMDAKPLFLKIKTIKGISNIMMLRCEDFIKRCDYAYQLKKNPVPFSPRNLGDNINSEYDDYWPSITASEDMLLLTVLVGKKQGESVQKTGVHEELFISRKDDNGDWTKTKNIGDPINTPGNEGAQSFSPDGRYMFFVACDRTIGMGGCDIYYSVRNGDTWSTAINPGPPLNSKYWESTPSISPAGDEILFSSNRPGGKGMKDIWTCKVNINEDGSLKFATPTNLDSINTDRDELSPFIHADNRTLYFSSNGHYGLGGYDVFVSRRKTARYPWGRPRNLGYPLNTSKDEIGFVVNGNGDKAFFSSDGIENRGRGREVYEVDLPEKLRPKRVKFIQGKIYDADLDVPIQAIVEIYTTDSVPKKVFETVSDKKDGSFTALIPTDNAKEEYGFLVRKKGYMFHSQHLTEDDPIINLRNSTQIQLERIEVGKSLVLNNVFFDFDSDKLKAKSYAELDRLIDFLRTNSRISIELAGHTDIKGNDDYNKTLSEKRANVVMKYLISKGIPESRLSSKGYGSSKPIADNNTESGRALNRRTEVVITKMQ